jgi:alkanesulfonate monooxygenase SsuD/methylene tetrahydromethanopterin reductase-like flavin-dependent oxidoreductase (luciferase family)
MDLGLILVTQYDESQALAGIAGELATQTELACDAGFDSLFVSEHHVTDHAYLANEAVLAHVVEHAGDMTIGTGMCLLPYHNPVRIAEVGATLDLLSAGNFTLGVAQGYRQAEFDAFGVPREHAVGRLVEGVEVIERLWTEDAVTYHGEHFDLEGVSINPRPVQEPRPPILAGASNESSIRRAAHYADGWIGAHVPFDVARAQVADFRDECEQLGEEKSAGLAREVFVAESDEAAEDAIRESLMGKYESYVEWGQDDAIESDDFDSPWEKLRHERFIVGGPETVRAEIQRYREAMDLEYLLARMQFPATDTDHVRSSIELFGEEVVPEIE